MVLVREEQYRNKVISATSMVGAELSEYKGSIISQGNIFPKPKDEFTLEMLRPTTLGSRFTAAQLYERIRKAFIAQGLADIHFEFALASTTTYGDIGYLERQSKNFVNDYKDSTNSYSWIYPIISPSGSYTENLAPPEVLIVIVPNSKNLVLKSLLSLIHI